MRPLEAPCRTPALTPRSNWLEADRVTPLSLEDALRPPTAKESNFVQADYTNLVAAFAEAARHLKRHAKRPAQPALQPRLARTPISSPSPAVAAPVTPPPPAELVLDGSLEDLLVSIAPAMARARSTLTDAGIDDVATLLRLREPELRDLLALVPDLLPLHRILLISRLTPHLAAAS